MTPGALRTPVGTDKQPAVGRIDDVGRTVITHFKCERGKGSEKAVDTFIGLGIDTP